MTRVASFVASLVLLLAVACGGSSSGSATSTPTAATATGTPATPTSPAASPTAAATGTPSASAPAAPTDVQLSGALPDLNTPVPPGQGELGRLTVSWTDNSQNETGFRVYQECEGTVTPLLEVPADETQYGPFQTCRPGRVGVAAYNADGVSEITWAGPAPAATATPSASAPAAPTDVQLSGALPDLNTPVPPGQGELGRLTVSWTDNSQNETGFRVYQECEGTVTPLLEVPADETQYGPFQTCRPGRVGVAAYNADGVSEITWAN